MTGKRRARAPAKEGAPPPASVARQGAAGSSAGGVSNQSLQAMLRPSSGAPGPRLHQGPEADRALHALRAPGAAVGQNIFLARGLLPPRRATVLNHELRHVAQNGGRDVNLAARLRVGAHDDRWERAARSGSPVGNDADPQVIRLFGPDEEANSSELSSEPAPLSSSPDSDAAGVCSVDDDALLSSSSSEPAQMSSQAESVLTSEQDISTPPVCEGSFDPEAVDVAGMRNDTLNTESLRVDSWINENALMSPEPPDSAAYRRLQARLKMERNARVQTGHLWLTTAVDPAPDALYMLMTGGGTTNIIKVNPEFALGVPKESFPGPIMSRQQFDDHMAALGVPILTEEQYFERLRQTAEQIAPELLVPPELGPAGALGPWGDDYLGQDERFRGYAGGVAQLDMTARMIQQTLPYRNVNVRAGDIGEAFGMAHHGRFWQSDYNTGRMVWSGDFLRPLRRTRGAVPVADMPLYGHDTFRDASIKVLREGTAASRSPSARFRYATLLSGHVDILDTSAPKFQRFAEDFRSGMSLPEVSAGLALMIPQHHVAGYQDVIRNATGRDLTKTGATATRPNYDLQPFKRIYELTTLPAAIDLQDGQPPLRTGAEIYGARDSGRINNAQFESFINQVGNAAANRVVGFDMDRGAIEWYEGYRRTFQPGTGARDTRAALSVEAVQVLEEQRRSQQLVNPDAPYSSVGRTGANLTVSHRNARRGGGLQGLFSIGGSVLLRDADLSDPRVREQILKQAAVEGAVGYGTEFGESFLRSRAGLRAMEEGLEATAPRLLARRIGARSLPVLGDIAVESYGLLTEQREHSVEEVIVRTGRAAVIGAGSTWAGAAVGTAIGGPIGFVVGFGVGAFVGWVGNKLIPGGAEDWERADAERRQREELARRRAEAERRLEELQARQRRLTTPLDSEAASSVGVEALFGLPTNDPRFLQSDPLFTPTIGELEEAYLLATLEQAVEAESQMP